MRALRRLFPSSNRLGRYEMCRHLESSSSCCYWKRPRHSKLMNFDARLASASSFQSPSSGYRRFCSARTISDEDIERYREPSDTLLKEIQAENARTQEYLSPGLQTQIAREIQEATATLLETVPELGPSGQYLYYTQDDSIGTRRYVREIVSTGHHQLALNVSLQKYQLHSMSLSVDEEYLAYLVSETPSQSILSMQVRVRHVETEQEFIVPLGDHDKVGNIEFGPINALDGSHSLFYTTSNSAGRPHAVWEVSVMPDLTITEPIKIYQCDNDAAMVDVQRTKGCQFVAISASTKTSNELRLVGDLHRPSVLVRERQEGVQYHVDVGVDGDVLVLAHAVEPNHASGLDEELTLFDTSIVELPLGRSFGTRFDAPADEFVVTDMDMFQDFIALFERSTIDGGQRVRVTSRKAHGDSGRVVPLPYPNQDCAVLTPGGNMWYQSSVLRFCMETPCRPRRTYTYDVSNDNMQCLGQENDAALASDYIERRVLVSSSDGTKIPLSLICRRDALPSSTQRRPTLLIGYGAYGEPVYNGFDPTLLPLVDRGFTIAYAHTRGGGDLGRAWYRAGSLYNKIRAIEDYLACAEALVKTLGVADSGSLFGKSFSAGGVLVASAVEKNPSLFRGVVLTNPFLDVAGSASHASWLREHEWDEWGNPALDAKAAACIARYCPMSNLSTQPYPSMLLVGTLDDVHVPYWHPYVYALKVRRNVREQGSDSTDGVHLHIEQTGGHHMHGRRLDIASMEVSFILTVLNEQLEEPGTVGQDHGSRSS